MAETAELANTFTQQPEEAVSSPTGTGTGLEPEAGTEIDMDVMGMMGGTGARRPLLVRPPQLPVDDLTVLGTRDEDDISLLEEFFIDVIMCATYAVLRYIRDGMSLLRS